jgi:hypothetical protein
MTCLFSQLDGSRVVSSKVEDTDEMALWGVFSSILVAQSAEFTTATEDSRG